VSAALDASKWDAAAYGWASSPLAEGSKRPLPGSHGFKDATASPEGIERLFTGRNGVNRAIATGAVSGGLLVIDVDRKSGVNGDKSLAEIEHEHGPLPKTRIHSTPSGGRHLLFTYDPYCYRIRSRTGIRPGLDVRADDGYIVAPPSQVGGKPYAIIDAREPATAPQWLVDLLCEPRQTSKAKTSPAAGPSVSVETIRAGLETLDNGLDKDRDYWVLVGAATHGATGGASARRGVARLNALGKIVFAPEGDA
jgi:hypothetical protein